MNYPNYEVKLKSTFGVIHPPSARQYFFIFVQVQLFLETRIGKCLVLEPKLRFYNRFAWVREMPGLRRNIRKPIRRFSTSVQGSKVIIDCQ